MTGQRVTRNPFSPDPRFSESFKRQVVREFEMGLLNKKQLARKYGIAGHDGIQISMTENGDPYENPVAERMNGILKDEFGIDLVKGDLKTNRLVTEQSIRTYNRLRPHLSCSMLTPRQMHAQDAAKLKTWRRSMKKASSNQGIT